MKNTALDLISACLANSFTGKRACVMGIDAEIISAHINREGGLELSLSDCPSADKIIMDLSSGSFRLVKGDKMSADWVSKTIVIDD